MVKLVVDLIKSKPQYLLEHHKYKDISGRTFLFVSPFQYLLWSHDVKFMGPAVLKALEETNADLRIFQGLKKQMLELAQSGLGLEFQNEFRFEHHFDFNPLITAFKEYIDGYNLKKSKHELYDLCRNIGMQQRFLPQNIRQEFCNSHACLYFDDTRRFVNQLSRSTHVYNSIDDHFMEWNNHLPGLGVYYALVRGYGQFCVTRTGEFRHKGQEERDLYVLILLQHYRINEDKPNLEKYLDTILTRKTLSSTHGHSSGLSNK